MAGWSTGFLRSRLGVLGKDHPQFPEDWLLVAAAQDLDGLGQLVLALLLPAERLVAHALTSEPTDRPDNGEKHQELTSTGQTATKNSILLPALLREGPNQKDGFSGAFREPLCASMQTQTTYDSPPRLILLTLFQNTKSCVSCNVRIGLRSECWSWGNTQMNL